MILLEMEEDDLGSVPYKRKGNVNGKQMNQKDPGTSGIEKDN